MVPGAAALAELKDRVRREDEEVRAGVGDAASSSPRNMLRNYQFILAKLDVLQVRDIRRSGTGGNQDGGGERGRTGH